MTTIARKLVGPSNDRGVDTYQPRIAAISALETELVTLSDDELRARTEQFKKAVAGGKGLDDLNTRGRGK